MNAVMHKLESCTPWTEEWITIPSTPPQTKSKSMKKHLSWATAYNSFYIMRCNQTKIFELLLLGQIKWCPIFNHWPLPSPRIRRVKKVNDFSKYAIIYSMYFNALYWKICIALLLYVWFSQIRSNLIKEAKKVPQHKRASYTEQM